MHLLEKLKGVKSQPELRNRAGDIIAYVDLLGDLHIEGPIVGAKEALAIRDFITDYYEGRHEKSNLRS